MKKKTVGIVTSRGGHLLQMYQLKPWWSKLNRFWVTFPGEDSLDMLKTEKVYYGYYPESRNIINAFKNFVLAWKILRIQKPDYLISCGAGIAPPFFYMAKLLGCKLIFVEPYDFIAYPSLSTKIVLPIIDDYIVQHKEQLRFSPKANYQGSLL